jgi:TP901 family phage tail tape measure protein
MAGVIDVLRISYSVDVVDKGTKPLLASERAVQRSLIETTRALQRQDMSMRRSATVTTGAATRQDAAVRRSANVSTSSAARVVAAREREGRAAQFSAGGTIKLVSAQEAAAKASDAAAASARRVTVVVNEQTRATQRLTAAERTQAASARRSASAGTGAATVARRSSGASGSSAGAAATAGTVVGKGVKTGALVGAVGVGLALSQTIQFDKAMRNVNSIAQLGEGRFKALSKSVLGLAGKTAQAPKTLAEGLYDLVSSGFNAKQSLTILKSSAMAATAGLTDTATSTKAVAAVLNAYHRPASDAARVSDTLFQTVNKGVISFEQLASTVGDVLPFASQLGINLDAIGAAASTLTKAGISPEETMTRLKNVMVTMLKPGDALKDAFKKLGVAGGEDLIKHFGGGRVGLQRGLEAIVNTAGGAKDLQKAYRQLGVASEEALVKKAGSAGKANALLAERLKTNKSAIAQLFPNIRSLGGALALTGINARSANKDLDSFGKASRGATSKAYAQQAKAVAFEWEKLKAQAKALGIEVGSRLVPAMNKGLHALNALARGKGPAGGLVKDFAAGFSPPDQTRQERRKSSGNTALRRDQQGVVQDRQQASADPSLGQKAGAFARSALTTIGDTAKRLGPILLKAGKQLLDAFKPAMPFLQNVLIPLLKGVAQGVIVGIVGVFKIAVPIIKLVATALGFVGKVLTPLKGAIQMIGQIIGLVFGGPILVKAVSWLGKLGGGLRFLGAPIRALSALFKGLGTGMGAIGKAFAGLAGKAGGALMKLPGLAGHAITAVFDAVRSGASKLAQIAFTAVAGIARPFGSLGVKIVKAAGNALSDIYGFFRKIGGGIIRSISGSMRHVGSSMIESIKDGIRSAIGSVGAVFASLKPEFDVKIGLHPHFHLKLGGHQVFRKGGIARQFQEGGLVPIVASGGEMMVSGGQAMMIPGPSNRDATPMLAPAGAAILTGSGQAMMAGGASLGQALAGQAPHFRKGGKVPKYYGAEKITPGGYTATSYGPPWGGIQGNGQTRTGVDLRGGPHRYIVAVDPSMISLKSKVYVNPNPFGYGGQFSAEDTGGAIKGRRLDFYDWRGRARQQEWGKQPVSVSSKRFSTTKGAKTAPTTLGTSARRAGLLDDAFSQGMQAGQEGLTRGIINTDGNPILQAIAQAINGAGTQADKGGGGVAPGTSQGDPSLPAGSKIAAMGAKASQINARHYPYAWGGGHGAIGQASVGTRTSRGGPKGLGFDCSGAVSAVLAAGGTLKSPMTSGSLMGWGQKGSGKRLGVYADAKHVIMRIGQRFFGTGEANPNGGAGWLPSNTMAGRGVVRTWPGMRHGGLVHRFKSGGSISGLGAGMVPAKLGGGATGMGRALSGALKKALSFAGGSLEAMDNVIGRSLEDRLMVMREQLQRQVAKGGSAKTVKRLQNAIDLIDFELGRRVGRGLDVVAQRSAGLERHAGSVDRGLRLSGVAADSSQGLAVMRASQEAETGVRKQNVTTLTRALKTATAEKNRAAIRDITSQLDDAKDALAESMVKTVEIYRDWVRSLGAEAVSSAQFGLGLAQGGASMLDAQQRLSQTTDTAGGMRERAGAITGGVIPALQGVKAAADFNAQMLAAVGDVNGWRQAVQDAQTATVDLANAQADAADLIRQAAAKEAQDRVDAATHGRTMSDLGLARLDLEQQLIGTHDTASGGMGRSDFIKSQILPAIQAEITALMAQQDAAKAAGDAALAEQIGEAVYSKQNEVLQAQLDAQNEIKANTDALKDFGGSTAFSYRDQTFVDVNAARVGA